MNLIPGLRLGAVARLSLGLVALMVSMLLAGDLLFGFSPSRAEAEQKARQRVGESVAIQVAVLLETGSEYALNKTLQQVVSRNKDVRSMAIRRTGGKLIAQQGDHARYWIAPQDGRSTVDQLRIPVKANNEHWADIEIAFEEAAPRGIREWLAHPTVRLLGFLALAGSVLFYLYLRRAMQYLDPSSAVPERVRKAFDVLADGVVVLDTGGRIVLVNDAFHGLHPQAGLASTGKRLTELEWLQAALGERPSEALPWNRALRDAAAVAEEPLSIPQPDGSAVEAIVGCARIADGNGRLRGCIVTFDDVTEVHRKNDQLQQALEELEESRKRISIQNEELRQLATRDPLTGCWNRRAFVRMAGDLIEQAKRDGSELSCIMGDIDHFKRFNDVYGHAVGDKVIQAVAKALGSKLREGDVLCRYGGEEFCIVLPNATAKQAAEVAERARETVEAHAGESIRSTDVGKVTSSFGVATLKLGPATLDALVDRADTALYTSKNNGRNQVTVWQAPAQ